MYHSQGIAEAIKVQVLKARADQNQSLKASVKQNTSLRLRVTLSDISNARKSVSSGIQTLRGGLKNKVQLSFL